MRAAIGGTAYLVHGGFEFDGRPISATDPAESIRWPRSWRGWGRRAAVVGVFAPVDVLQEEWAAARLRERLPDLDITLSHEIAGAAGARECGDPQRLPDAAGAADDRGLREAVARLGLDPAPRLYLSQNDGTLIDADYAARHPVLTFASGPTNSMRGAVFLSGLAYRDRARYRRHDD
ncbi:MAG: hypothetical protein U0841_04250 [Chloroflexia bacterium]